MAEYTINVVNNSGSNKDYVVFQKEPEINANGRDVEIFSNAWITFSGIMPGNVDTLTYEDMTYAYWGSVPTQADPSTSVARYGTVQMDTSQLQSVPFIAGPPTGFGDVTSSSDADQNSGSFQIVGGSDFTVKDNYLFGLAKPTQTGVPGPVATFLAEPNCTYDIIPVMQFYVADGKYTAGDIINVKKFSSVSGVIDFTGRSQTTATVTQGDNGLFTVEYT